MTTTTVRIAAPAPARELADLETLSGQLAAAERRVDELRAARNHLIVTCVEHRRYQLVTTAAYAGVSPQQCIRVILAARRH